MERRELLLASIGGLATAIVPKWILPLAGRGRATGRADHFSSLWREAHLALYFSDYRRACDLFEQARIIAAGLDTDRQADSLEMLIDARVDWSNKTGSSQRTGKRPSAILKTYPSAFNWQRGFTRSVATMRQRVNFRQSCGEPMRSPPGRISSSGLESEDTITGARGMGRQPSGLNEPPSLWANGKGLAARQRNTFSGTSRPNRPWTGCWYRSPLARKIPRTPQLSFTFPSWDGSHGLIACSLPRRTSTLTPSISKCTAVRHETGRAKFTFQGMWIDG